MNSHETTANALGNFSNLLNKAFAITLLSIHKDVQEKLRKEIRNNIYKNDEKIELNYENTKDIDYLNFGIKINN
jgi:hypothetical protein